MGTKQKIVSDTIAILLNRDGRTNDELLAARNKLPDKDLVLFDVLERKKTMSTGMTHGIALPHAKTTGVDEMVVAVGIKKEGIDFESTDGEKYNLFMYGSFPEKSHRLPPAIPRGNRLNPGRYGDLRSVNQFRHS